MGSSKKIAKGVFWTTLQTLINGIYGFISVPLLIAYFGKSNYGLIGLALSINVYLCLMDLGFNNTSVRYFSNWCAQGKIDKVKHLFSTNLTFYGILGLLNALILIIISFFSDEIFKVSAEQNIILKNLLYILAISAFIGWYTSVFNQILQGNEYVGWVQKFVFIPKCLQIIILILTLTFHFSIELYYLLTTFSTFITLPIIIWKIKKVCPYVSFIPGFDKSIFKEMLPYSLQVFSFGFFQFSANYLRPVILGIRGNMESVTDFRILNGVVNIVILLGGMFLGIVMPSASKVVAQNNIEAQDRIAYQGTKFLSIFVCFCSFGMMSISRDLIIAYVGYNYLYLVKWMNLWLVMTALTSHIQCMSSLILAGTNVKGITISTIIASLVTIMSCWLITPYFQVGGAILSYAFFGIILLSYYYLYYYKKIMHKDPVKIFFHSFFPFFIIGFIIAFCVMQIDMKIEIWENILIKGVIFVLTFTVISYVILNNEERLFLKKLVKV